MDSHVEEAYLREILIQAEYAVVAVQNMNGLVDAASPVLFFREAQCLLMHAAAVSRILWPPAKGSAVAVARGEHIRAALAVADTHSLRSRTLRDHHEHFDERLKAAALQRMNVLWAAQHCVAADGASPRR